MNARMLSQLQNDALMPRCSENTKISLAAMPHNVPNPTPTLPLGGLLQLYEDREAPLQSMGRTNEL